MESADLQLRCTTHTVPRIKVRHLIWEASKYVALGIVALLPSIIWLRVANVPSLPAPSVKIQPPIIPPSTVGTIQPHAASQQRWTHDGPPLFHLDASGAMERLERGYGARAFVRDGRVAVSIPPNAVVGLPELVVGAPATVVLRLEVATQDDARIEVAYGIAPRGATLVRRLDLQPGTNSRYMRLHPVQSPERLWIRCTDTSHACLVRAAELWAMIPEILARR